MKSLMIFISPLVASSVAATAGSPTSASLDSSKVSFAKTCKVTKVFDSGFLEESLTDDETSKVEITLNEVKMGKTTFSIEKGDEIKEAASVKTEKNIEIIQANGDVKYFISVSNLPTNKSGTLTGQVKGEAALKIADLDCQ